MPSPLVLAPIALAILAEAAWTAVLAGMLQAFALRGPTLGIPGTLVACLAGLAAAKWLEPRAGDRWPALAAALTIGIAIVGWLASPEVRSILGERGIDAIGAAIIANIGGFVAGIAFLRGVPYARLPPDPRPIGRRSASATPGIALAAIVGGMVGDPYRAAFLSDTTGEVVVFLVAGIAALTLSRLTMVGSGAGAGSVDWRRNPAWLGLAAFLLASIAVTAFATSAVAGPVIVTVLGVMIPSLLILGFVIGFDRRSLRIVAICVAIALFIAQLAKLLGAQPRDLTAPPAPLAPPAAPDVPAPMTLVLVAIAVALAIVAVIVLITLWMLRPRVDADVEDEDRWIDHGDQTDRERLARRRRGSRLGRRRPADAVAAYRALLEDLAPRPGVRRDDGETPAEHAGRLRDAGTGALALDLLAADYGLVRFGDVRLSDAEERRAVRRASILRRLLVGQRQDSKGAGAGPGAAAKPGEDAALGDGPGARSRFRVG